MKAVQIAWVSALLFAVAACAGKELLDLGGDGGQDSHGGDGAASVEGSVSREGGASSSGAAQDATGSSSGSSGGGGLTDGGAVPGNAFPCGFNVCSGSEVCCEEPGLAPTCQAPSQCDGGAFGCTSATCPTGSLCCVSLQDAGSSDYLATSSQCLQTTSCPAGTLLACDEFGSASGCPPNYTCFGSPMPSCLGPFGPYDAGAE